MSRPLLLSCEAVNKTYGTRSLFDDLSFGLFEGDQAGLVGPNGSGKSTLLKILAGDTTPDRGSRSLELTRVYPTGLFETEGRYSEFLARRDDFLRGQAAYQESLANTVRREIEWLRRGAKARSTKAKGRIKEAGRLIDELEDSRARGVTARAGIDFTSSRRRTRRLLVARGLTQSPAGRRPPRAPEPFITPRTRGRLVGPHSRGQTTLLHLLAGALPPDGGEIERADGLRIVRFEQERGGLVPTQSLRRALAPDGDAVTWQGRSVHVASS